MLTSEQFLVHLRSALNHFYDPYFLRNSPLVKLFGLGTQPDTPSALQRILNEAINALEPAADDPYPEQNRLGYELILYRYVQQFSQEEVAAQLGLSVRHLRRKQNAAIYRLGAYLWERYNPGHPLHPEAALELDEPAGTESGDSEDSSDLDWLKDTPLTEPADLKQVLHSVLELSQPLAARHQVTLTMNAESELPILAVQAMVLRQILINTFSAAISFARQGQIAFSVPISGLNAEMCVNAMRTLNGPEPETDSQHESLSIAARMAKLCGGKLEFVSESGKLDICLSLPVFRPINVLVIDDNPDFHQLIQRETSGTRYKVIGERDPEKGLALAEAIIPNVILLDVMMPHVDGWEILGRLRRHPRTERIPVIICTVLAQQDLALSLGAKDFVRKPIKREQILAALDRQVALLEQESHS